MSVTLLPHKTESGPGTPATTHTVFESSIPMYSSQGASDSSSTRMTVDDVYFILFRHKWKIFSLLVIGLAAAIMTFRTWPQTVYKSEAKLFIRYLEESTEPGSVGSDARIISPDQRGETIMNSELEIITSMDLAKEVASKIGPDIILKAYGGGSDLDQAAGVINAGLEAEAPRGSRVITLSYKHADPKVAQPVLTQLISEYLKKHMAIHRATGLYDDLLSKETLQLRSRLAHTEEELARMKDRAGVISIEESKRAYAEQISKVRQAIFDTEAEMAERRAILAEFGGVQTEEEKVPADKARAYRNVIALLDALNRREQEMMLSYQPDTPMLIAIRDRIAANETLKAELEEQYPSLAMRMVGGSDGPKSTNDFLNDERQAIRVLETRLTVLQDHLQRLRGEASELGTLELSLSDLQRRRDLEEQHYRYFSSSLEQSRINEALSSGRVSNISIVEEPTQPVADVGQLYQMMGGFAGGGLALGLALAFGIELFIDRSVKRPRDVRQILRLPLALSVPRLHIGRRARRLAWVPDHPMRIYFDSLRNQIIHDFDVRDLLHKPKLVAVTGCGVSSGVSTIAAGIAASLSKSGEGNILLLDMNPYQSTPHYYHKGDTKCDVIDLLDGGNLSQAQVDEHLYLASIPDGSKSQLVPTRFANLIPKFRGSDFDYIVFDMPPINQLTSTAQLAHHMDTILLVAEAEKTPREQVGQAAAMLNRVTEHFGIVLNKTREYLPSSLKQEV